jgi:hypothetical protein
MAKEWLEYSRSIPQGINFTSGGIFSALLLSEAITLEEAIPFIKDFFDYMFPQAKRVQDARDTVSRVLKGGETEDILNFVSYILMLNSRLRDKVYIKEVRWYNRIVICGEREAVTVLSDLFQNGKRSKYVSADGTGYVLPPDMLGEDLIDADPRHQVEPIYPDLPVHTPMVEPPAWFEERLSRLNIKKPVFPILGQRYEELDTPFLVESVKEGLLGVINTAGTFDELLQEARLVSLGAPQWFLDNIGHTGQRRPILLTDPHQTIAPEETARVADSPIIDGQLSSNEDNVNEVPGGIDFNPKNLNLREQGQALDFQFAGNLNIEADQVEGIVPVIINITPITYFPWTN